MSKLFEFKINYGGVGQMLKGPEVRDMVEAETFSRVPGEGYDGEVVMADSRWIGHVKAVSDEAIKDNLDNNTLLKARG